MSDYISKSALIDMIVNTPSVDIPRCASAIFRNGYYNGKAERQHEIIDIIDALPTLSETEIIRKAFERVVERLEGLRAKPTETVYDTVLIGSIIGILKEECGINE